MGAIFWIFGIFNMANGVWMILVPRAWYYGLPARVPDTGPLNVHFVRDIGAAFLTLGIAFCFTAPRALRHRGVVLAAAVFYALHGLIHVSDLASGRLDAWTLITGSSICQAFFFPRSFWQCCVRDGGGPGRLDGAYRMSPGTPGRTEGILGSHCEERFFTSPRPSRDCAQNDPQCDFIACPLLPQQTRSADER